MPKSKVLKPCDYSFDGVRAKKALVGDEIDFGDMTAGLASEGYVEAATGKPEVAAPEPAEPVVEPVIEPAVDPEPVVTPEPEVAAPEPKQTRKRR